MDNQGIWMVGKNNKEQVIVNMVSLENSKHRICSNKDSDSRVVVTTETSFMDKNQIDVQNLHPGNCLDVFGFKITIANSSEKEAKGTYQPL